MSVLCLLWLRLVYQCRHHHPNSACASAFHGLMKPTSNYCLNLTNRFNQNWNYSHQFNQFQSQSLVHSDTTGMSIISLSNKGNFGPDIFSEQKQLIINLGPHQPKGPSPKDQECRNKNRGFDEKW